MYTTCFTWFWPCCGLVPNRMYEPIWDSFVNPTFLPRMQQFLLTNRLLQHVKAANNFDRRGKRNIITRCQQASLLHWDSHRSETWSPQHDHVLWYSWDSTSSPLKITEIDSKDLFKILQEHNKHKVRLHTSGSVWKTGLISLSSKTYSRSVIRPIAVTRDPVCIWLVAM